MSLQLKNKMPLLAAQDKLASGFPAIDHFMEGGLAFGQVSEWGMPWGCGGRRLLVGFVATATQKDLWVLWVHDRKDLSIYPPAWQSAGVDLRWLRVVDAQAQGSLTITLVKPALMSSFFKIIVIDSHLPSQDYAFLAQRARLQQQLIIVIRQHPLSSRLGNVWARSRLNAWRDPLSGRFYLSYLKGLSPRQISIKLEGGLL